MADAQFETLSGLLDAVEERNRADGGLSMGVIGDIAGDRAFGAMILLPALVTVSPLSGIPTVPTMVGVIVMLLSAQLVLGRSEPWLPKRLAGARLSSDRVHKVLRFMRRPVGWIDRVVRPRFRFATSSLGLRGAALICFVTAATMPPLEILPFMATTAGLVISIFALAITLRDGLLMIVGLLAAGGMAYAAWTLLAG
ncbi:exopolysaccharide biosynthesis protein [Aureimonas altamirensis]|uniref:exopolysaccharide biosynthesis protein n=1 Tax=Aureimonas altamirensis TaxID=370622 RepID=UPI0020370B79|nr:exopolysaccharide biosynthesis protein [Aureimonas altamirensis]MCM2503077.1 exopolysaccharide biosynthesis protein [Aureimonas altamirensis]